jgi:hypothetical protein
MMMKSDGWIREVGERLGNQRVCGGLSTRPCYEEVLGFRLGWYSHLR